MTLIRSTAGSLSGRQVETTSSLERRIERLERQALNGIQRETVEMDDEVTIEESGFGSFLALDFPEIEVQVGDHNMVIVSWEYDMKCDSGTAACWGGLMDNGSDIGGSQQETAQTSYLVNFRPYFMGGTQWADFYNGAPTDEVPTAFVIPPFHLASGTHSFQLGGLVVAGKGYWRERKLTVAVL